MRRGGTPRLDPGIVQLELAGSERAAERVTAAWGSAGIDRASTALHWDFAFIPVYALLFALLYLIAAEALARRGMASPGLRAEVVLAWSAIVAGLLDVAENFALLGLL